MGVVQPTTLSRLVHVSMEADGLHTHVPGSDGIALARECE